MGADNVHFIEGEVEELPFDEHSFDVVTSNGVIDLIPDKDVVFASIFACSFPAGASRPPT